MATERDPVVIMYQNYNGELTVREILVDKDSLKFTSNEWHPEPQWIIFAHDKGKNAARSFALANIISWGLEATQRAVKSAVAQLS